MANVVVVPAAMALNDQALAGTSDYLHVLSTTSVYQIKFPKDGKVGVFIHGGPSATSSGVIRVKVDYAKSSDGLAWQACVGDNDSTGVATFWEGPSVAASSTCAFFLGPFESAKFGIVPSSLGYKVMNLNFDFSTASAVTESTLSSTNSHATVKLFAFEMP